MYGNGYITWEQGGEPIWTLKEAGMRANNLTMVSQRPISNEPMVGHLVLLGRVLLRKDVHTNECDCLNFLVRHPQLWYV